VQYCKIHNIFDSEEEILVASRLLFYRRKGSSILQLAIGAPSSPKVSNLLMYEFDRAISARVGEEFVTYTRYADDLTFSAKRTGYLNHVERAVRAVLREIPYPKLSLNDDKRVLATKKYHRQITGLVITNDSRVSLGRTRKRQLRAALHHFLLGRLTAKEAKRLHGLLAFARDVEPAFYARMEARYGSDTLKKLAATLGIDTT
jgi:hypothetical protein